MVVLKPCLLCLIKAVFTYAGVLCTNIMKKEDSNLFVSSVRAAQTMSSVVPLCNQATLSLPDYQYSQMFSESRGKNGGDYWWEQQGITRQKNEALQ